MKKTWGHFIRDVLCGCCGATIPAGTRTPILELDSGRQMIRCTGCGGEPPPDLPARVVGWQGRTKRMTPLSAVVAQYAKGRRG